MAKKRLRKLKKPVIKRELLPSIKPSIKYDIAMEFATAVYKQFGELIKSIILFGSTAKDTAEEKSDIDIIIIVDDATINWDRELIAWYREELGKLIFKQKYKKKLHINTVTLTGFWNNVMRGDPIVINVIRYGVALIDFGGFFSPLKMLLAKGLIKPTREAVSVALNRAPRHLSRANTSILAAVESVYWCMVDAAQAVLMNVEELAPSPEEIPKLLIQIYVNSGKLDMKYVEWFKEMYAVVHHISHGQITEVSGKEIHMYKERADEFLGKMAELVKQSS